MSAVAEPTPQRFANPLARYVAATRPPFLTVTLVGCLLGLASAWRELGTLDLTRAVVTVVFALVAQAAANVVNDYHDAVSGADAANTGRLFPFTGGSRFIQNGILTPRQTAYFGYGLLLAVIPPGLWLAWVSGPGLLLIGVCGLATAWAYSAPPLKLASRGCGELAIAAGWWLIVVGSDYVQRGTLAWTPALAGVSYALLVANLLYINQFPDHAGDAAAGKNTLVVKLGPETAKWGYFGIAMLAYGWLVLQIGRYNLPQGCAAAAMTLILSLHASRQLREHASTPTALRPAIRLTILAALLHGLILAAALLLDQRS